MSKKKTPERHPHWYPKGTFTGKEPIEVTDVMKAFPANVAHMMPPANDIPEEFCEHNGNKWVNLVDTWFCKGLQDYSFNMKEGISGRKVFDHVGCIMRSFEPKHEYKTAACAYLLSMWCEDFQKVE